MFEGQSYGFILRASFLVKRGEVAKSMKWLYCNLGVVVVVEVVVVVIEVVVVVIEVVVVVIEVVVVVI